MSTPDTSSDNDNRDPENHPSDRASDRGVAYFVWKHKLYRDLWLVGITGLCLIALDNIQESRRETLIRSCQETNVRYDNAVSKLNTIVNEIEDPIQRARARANKDNTISLIATLAPKVKDCEARADRLIDAG